MATTLSSLRRRLALPAFPLQRLRAITLIGALGCAQATVFEVLLRGEGPPALMVVTVAAVIALAAHWCRGYRRGSFPLLGEPAEAVVLLLAFHVTAGEGLLMLFAIVFRSLYGPPPWPSGAMRCTCWRSTAPSSCPARLSP